MLLLRKRHAGRRCPHGKLSWHLFRSIYRPQALFSVMSICPPVRALTNKCIDKKSRMHTGGEHTVTVCRRQDRPWAEIGYRMNIRLPYASGRRYCLHDGFRRNFRRSLGSDFIIAGLICSFHAEFPPKNPSRFCYQCTFRGCFVVCSLCYMHII